jgi:hypothetical protein
MKRNVHPGAAGIIALVPALSSLVFFGVSGIAVCALLLGLFVMLREPLNELAALARSKGNSQKIKLIHKDIIEPYKLYWFCLFIFAAAAGIIVFFTELKLYFVLLVLAAACAVFFFSTGTLPLLGGNHRRFTPVMIIRRRFPDFAFSVYMFPFAAAAFAALLFAPYISGAPVSGGKFDHVIEEQDYYAHLLFQSSFSMRQLGTSETAYYGYKLDDDGLPSPEKKTAAVAAVKIDNFPPFPLKHLMEFFKSVNNKDKKAPAGGWGPAEILSILILAAFILPGFLLKGSGIFEQKGHFEGLKRFSGKLRRTDINRKKVLLYNRNTLRIRKDA